MKISEILSLSLLAAFFLLLGLSFFLNYLSALYSDASLFKVDLAKKRKDKKKVKKVIFILKNSNLLFAVVCFLQVFLNIFSSEIFMTGLNQIFLQEIGWTKYRWMIIVSLSLLIALITEILARYLASRPGSQKRIFNNFFISVTYLIVRIPYYFLRSIVRPRKKIFINSEKDIIRFINNLTTDNILEKNEAKLIQSAFNFDESKVISIITPWKNVICLKHGMTYPEIQAIHFQQFFTRYPVVNQKKEIIGIFNMEVFYWRLMKNKEVRWQDYVDKKVIRLSPQDKLDKVLTKLQNNNCRLAIVQEKKRLLGIVTLQDVLGALVGKIRDEREILLLPHRLN